MSKHTFEETISVVGKFDSLEELVYIFLEAKTGDPDYIDKLPTEFVEALVTLDNIWRELRNTKENE